VAVLDSQFASGTVQDVLGFGGDIPIVASFAEGMELEPNALLIGIAPAGGQFPASWRTMVLQALAEGMDVWSGLHTMLGDDAEFAVAANKSGARIFDLRRPPADLDVAYGRVRDLDATVVLTVGTDCNIGKMTTQLQIRDAVAARGHRVAFAATGQTGILIEGSGIAVDAVVADFIAGAAERLTIEAVQARNAEIVLVEGQGSLVHPAYSGVTLGLIHGSMPHAMVLCAQPSRTTVTMNEWVRIPPLPQMIRMHESIMEALRPSKVIAIALNTYDMTEADALAAIAETAQQTGLPVTDPVRFDPAPIADAIAEFHGARVSAAV
jgi:uncharacterized NAD-dependent epimerase/dehydratase family protein